MFLTIKKGDLFADDAEALVNAVNCKGVMGAGIAKAFRNRYPLYFLDYHAKCMEDRIVIGEVDLYAYLDEIGCRFLVSFPTMLNPGEATREDALVLGLESLVEKMNLYRIQSVAMPALGCGIGDFAFERLATLVATAFTNEPFDVRLYQPLESRR